VRVIAPVGERQPAEAFLGRGRQEARRDDLVGVDVRVRQYDCTGFDGAYGLHADAHCMNSRGSATLPAMALAAAVAGLASRVRAPAPWRPSKLRLLVLTAYSPRATVSPFMPMHIEQPDSRHCAPASVNILASPRASASRLTCCEPGTTSIRTPSATRLPRKMLAASSRSDSLAFVQLPTNTTWMGLPSKRSPPWSPM